LIILEKIFEIFQQCGIFVFHFKYDIQ
jgi:hypothetical protein